MFYKLRIPRTANTVHGQHRPRPPNGRDEQEWDISIHRNGASRFIAPKQNKHDERVEARDLIIAKRPRRNWTSWSAKLGRGRVRRPAQDVIRHPPGPRRAYPRRRQRRCCAARSRRSWSDKLGRGRVGRIPGSALLVSRGQQLVTTDTAAGDESCNGSATNSGSPPRATLGEMPTRWQGLSNSLYVPAPFRTHVTSLSNTMSHGGAHADGEQGPSLGWAPRRLERQHTNTKRPPTTQHTQHSHTENDIHTNTHTHPENDTHTDRKQDSGPKH